jgi:hypothetical protein
MHLALRVVNYVGRPLRRQNPSLWGKRPNGVTEPLPSHHITSEDTRPFPLLEGHLAAFFPPCPLSALPGKIVI